MNSHAGAIPAATRAAKEAACMNSAAGG